MTEILPLLRSLLAFVPFLLFVRLDVKANLKRQVRSRQIFMPVLALVYCIVLMILSRRLGDLAVDALNLIPRLLTLLASLFSGRAAFLADLLRHWGEQLAEHFRKLDIYYLMLIAFNTFGLLAHIIIKRILITFMKAFCKPGRSVYEFVAGHFYDMDEEAESEYLKPSFCQARIYTGCFFAAAVVISILAMLASVWMYRKGLLGTMFNPVYGVIVIGEMYFALNGLTKDERAALEGEDERSRSVFNYVMLRGALRRLFGDKLVAEDTGVSSDMDAGEGVESLLTELETTGRKGETYAAYMRKQMAKGFLPDRNYLNSGFDLLNGKSILFNNPFYYDLIPYAFYAMDRTLLRRKKALIILGRHGLEESAERWCREGLCSISNVPDLWRVGVLDRQLRDLDVGIVSRSGVHDEELHEANREFLSQVEYVVLIEPSRLMPTAQVGLNSLIRRCRIQNKTITYCSTDKNCDGLVDALSHVLMTSISEVAATERCKGTCSYMCWAPDGDRLQHRMLPNLSRYLGVGTELSFVALKYQISETNWYGGDAFPVTDIRWIVKQYYHDLMTYAGLPADQETLDRCFRLSPNLWSERVRKAAYLTVEDESFNMFEIKRNFATRAEEHGFVNVLSGDYLLRDYMADNDGIFNADPKAIPYIVADYARTPRNVALRLCLKMCTGYVESAELHRELLLVDADSSDPAEGLWTLLVSSCSSLARRGDGEQLYCEENGEFLCFTRSVIESRRRYSVELGEMEDQYMIRDRRFARVVLRDLRSARYIAEEEDEDSRYLGTELCGQVFQKYLPGQFFTFNGKYYEMLSVTSDGQVLVRRAADHISGRLSYRQVRRYVITAAEDSAEMGAIREAGGIRVTRQYADLRVETPAYWELSRYNDFSGGKLVTISGIPDRCFSNKKILCVEFPDSAEKFTDEVRHTLVLLINEVFRTLFAENQCFITAVCAGPAEVPVTYSLSAGEGVALKENAIYLIEDSQLDLGLLVAAERNLNRILSIIFDYLDWHLDTLDKSLNPPPPKPYEEPEEEDSAPVGLIGKVKQKLGSVFAGIGRFFKRIFGRKKRDGGTEAETGEEDPKNGRSGTKQERREEKRRKKQARLEEKQRKKQERREKKMQKKLEREEKRAGRKAGKEAPQDDSEPTAPEAEPAEVRVPAEGEAADIPEADAEETPDETAAVPERPEETETTAGTEYAADPEAGQRGENGETGEAVAESEEEENEDDDDDGPPLLMSISPSFRDQSPVFGEDDGIPADPAAEETADASGAPVPTEDTGTGEEPAAEQEAKGFVLPTRRPYHERYYLLYGGDEMPEWLRPEETLDFLRAFGLENGALKQARDNANVPEMIERTYDPTHSGSRFCDFCGVELSGAEYDVLADGRERCPTCSRTAIRSAAEFEALYKRVLQNMETFFGVRIDAPIRVEMVNAKKLHRRLGKSFVPTSKADGRVLGVAIKEKRGYSILLENGAPRMKSAMTIAHELTHIWQYLNWNAKGIREKYGKAKELEIYEGMAKWSEIQYACLVGETAQAKREEIITRIRRDPYGYGFNHYVGKYPLSYGPRLEGGTPFENPSEPL